MTVLAVVRAIHFAAAIQITGALLFVWIVGHAPRTGWDAEKDPDRRRLMLIAMVSVAVAVVSGAAWFALQVAEMADTTLRDSWTSGAIDTVLFNTHAGVIWSVRFAIATALTIDIVALAPAHRVPTPAALAVGFALAVANFVSCAWLGHAGSDPGRYGLLHLGVHAAHMLGVSLWVGGLIPLAMLLSRVRRSGDPVDAAHALHASIWFGNIALFAVCLIVLTGIANTAFLMRGSSDLTSGSFANLLATKMVLLLPMLILAVNNRQWLVPRLAGGHPSRAATWLWRNVLGEVALAVLLLVVAGMLGITPPGADSE
jgi:copper resistance protein D